MPLKYPASSNSNKLQIQGDTGMNLQGVYAFSITPSMPIEPGSSLQITLPPEVGIGEYLQFKGIENISRSAQLTKSSTGKLRLSGCFKTYLTENSTINFTITGLINPQSVIPSASFELRTQDP